MVPQKLIIIETIKLFNQMPSSEHDAAACIFLFATGNLLLDVLSRIWINLAVYTFVAFSNQSDLRQFAGYKVLAEGKDAEFLVQDIIKLLYPFVIRIKDLHALNQVITVSLQSNTYVNYLLEALNLILQTEFLDLLLRIFTCLSCSIRDQLKFGL